MRFRIVLVILAWSIGIVQAQDRVMMLVGTFTDGNSKGIYSCRFDQQTGESEILDSLTMAHPTYLTFSPDRRLVYAATHEKNALLNTVSVNHRNGDLQLLSSSPVMGSDPCYVATNGKIVVTANYSGGSMSVFKLSRQGVKADLDVRFLGATGGPDLSRQDSPHMHCACFTPDGKYILATDFSADRIVSFCVKGQEVIANGIAAKISDDSGPRHITFSPNGRFAYVMSELSGKVTVFRYHDGRLETLQEIVSDSVGARGGADIHISPDGKFLYSSNRLKAEGIAIFAIDSQTGMLTRIGYQPTGAHPRQFNITPNGKFLLCCCRDSNKIQVFRRDKQTGMLTDTHRDIPVSRAVCVLFLSDRNH